MSVPESVPLRLYLRRRPEWVSSGIVETEILRMANRLGPQFAAGARQLLARMTLLRVSPGLLRRAGELDPAELRSLDAIHVAAAESLAPDLGVVVTYDLRVQAAAERLGLRSVAPS